MGNSLRIDTPIRIDGWLDEEAWSAAETLDDFVQILPDNNGPVKYATTVKSLSDENHLYFGVFCADSIQDYRVSVRRDFNDTEQDCIGLILDAFGDGRVVMSFFTNPFGAQKDMMIYDGIDVDGQWDAYWHVKTTRTKEGWFAEFAIPWVTLRYKSGLVQWKFNVVRRSRAINEISAWSWYPRFVLPYRMQFAGLLEVQPPKQGINLRVQPYALGSFSESSSDSATLRSAQSNYGLDVKWAFTPKDVVDVTIRTDFAQADVDRRVININRSSVFLPERRSFFLENASLFGDGLKPSGPNGHSMLIIPFFSRRIGLDASGLAIPISHGARYVHRSNAFNYGAMYMQEGVERGKQYSINRLSVNLGDESRLGLLHTYEGNSNTRNQTLAVDGLIRLDEKNQLKSMVSTTLNDDGSQGAAAFMQFDHTSDKLMAFWRQAFVEDTYRPSVGFVSRTDVMLTMPGFWFTIRPQWLPKSVLFFEPGVVSEFFHRASTRALQEYSVTYIPFWFTYVKGGYSGFVVTDNYQFLEAPIMLSGIEFPAGSFRYWRFVLLVGTDQSRIFSFNTTAEAGRFYNGQLDKINLQLVFRPNERLRLSNTLEVLRFCEIGAERLSETQKLFISESRFAFSPRLSIAAFLQYNSTHEELGGNVRLSWEFQPLSFVYLIYNHGTIGTNTTWQQDNTVLLKVSFLKQF